MESNSIKDNLSKEDMISDILLCLGADIHRENIYLLVEGEDDIKFLRSFLADNVYIYESYDGKNGVEYIVGELFFVYIAKRYKLYVRALFKKLYIVVQMPAAHASHADKPGFKFF